jgi:uroporphyrinogen III methyltransferase/synthase
VRGRQRLLQAQAVVYDRLAAAALPCDLPPAVELHGVGKAAGHHPVPQEEINALLVRLALEGKRVARLKGGDPFVFGRGGEEAERLAAEGIPFEIVPGVTSGVAAPAWVGIPVTHRRESVRLTLLTAHESAKAEGPQMRWDLLAKDPHATLVGYMGLTALPRVVEKLLAAGMDPATPAAVIQEGTLAGQRSVVSSLTELADAARREGLEPPALFVIGPTVKHAERLDWQRRLPLAGERLVVAAAHGALALALERAGAEVVVVPLPVTPAARIVMGVSPLSGCLLRSASEVEAFDEERGGAGWQGSPTAWCQGPATVSRARQLGWRWVDELEEELDIEGMVARIRRRRVPSA